MSSILPSQQLNPALINATKAVPDINMQRIDETARDFEAMFLSEMLKPMFDTVKVDPMFGGGKGEEVFSAFLRDEYAKGFAKSGGIGIAELVKQQLIEMQGKARNPNLAQNMHGNMTGTEGETNAL